MATKAH